MKSKLDRLIDKVMNITILGVCVVAAYIFIQVFLLFQYGPRVTPDGADIFIPSGVHSELAEAAASGRTDTIDRLLGQGAQVDYQGETGVTPLIWAWLNKSTRGFQYLLVKGADPNLAMLTEDGQLCAPIFLISSSQEHPEFLKILLQYGGDPNMVDAKRGLTPIFEVINASGPTAIQKMGVLIKAGADLDFQREGDGYTPLMAAASVGRYDLIYQLLQAEANPGIATNQGISLQDIIRENLKNGPHEPRVKKWRELVLERLGLNSSNAS